MHTLISFLLAPSILFVLILVGGLITYTGYQDYKHWKDN